MVTKKITVVIGNDHAGFNAKKKLVQHLTKQGYVVVDVGGFTSATSDDYPDFASQVAKLVAKDKQGKTKGVLICGSGTGMVIAANKVKGVRAAMVYDHYGAQMARHDNDANVITLRGRNFPVAKLPVLVDTFLGTPFSDIARHKRRIKKISKLER